MNACFADMLHFLFHFVCSFIINNKHIKILASSRRNNSKFIERPPTCLADPGSGKSNGSGDTKQAPQSLIQPEKRVWMVELRERLNQIVWF